MKKCVLIFVFQLSTRKQDKARFKEALEAKTGHTADITQRIAYLEQKMRLTEQIHRDENMVRRTAEYPELDEASEIERLQQKLKEAEDDRNEKRAAFQSVFAEYNDLKTRSSTFETQIAMLQARTSELSEKEMQKDEELENLGT
jgi:hypothetical protein